MKESAPTRCPNGHPLGPNTVLVGALPCLRHPPATVHRTWRCMHDAAGVFPQPRVDSLAIHLSRQVDPGSCARSDGGTRAARTAERSLLAGLRPLLVFLAPCGQAPGWTWRRPGWNLVEAPVPQ